MAMIPGSATPAALADDLGQRIGQMVVIGFHGDSADDPRFTDVLRQLEEGVAGGVLFLDYNIASAGNLRRMTEAIRACRCRHRPFIAVDEEGGRVQRLGKLPGETPSPAADETGARGDPGHAARIFDEIADRVRRFGFNLNLGPVVDVNLNPDGPAIGRLGRSYSSDPNRVAELARLFVRSHRKAGVLTALKHFPGHGSARADTHLGETDVGEVWRPEAELLPFRRLIASGDAVMVMAGHLTHRSWGGVASLSPATAISGLLRGRLGYRGAVISDDLEMGAVRGSDPADVIVRAIGAGNDLLIFSNRLSDRPRLGDWITAQVMSAITTGRLDSARVDQSYARIMMVKSALRGKGASP